MRPRVAFLGSPAFAVPSLRAACECAEIRRVVTQPDRPAGRGRQLEPTAVRRAAEELGLPVRTWERGARAALESELAALDLDLLVVVAFGVILRSTTLATARCGALNVHASLLPRWRGVAPIERAILAGDSETGVSLMVIDLGVDTGPVLATRREPITPEDTRVSLAARLADRGAELLTSGLEAFVSGRTAPVPQPADGITYAPRLSKEEGRIDWERDAPSIANQVRGLYEWPGAFTRLGGVDLKVHAARAEPGEALAPPGTVIAAEPKGAVRVACGAGTLELVVVQLAGKPRVQARDLARGRVLRAGLRLGERE